MRRWIAPTLLLGWMLVSVPVIAHTSAALVGSLESPETASSAAPQFTFAVTADMRSFSGPGLYDTSQYFRGAVEAISNTGPTVFILSPGDIDPPGDVLWTITRTMGVTYTWYPLIGNHEVETAEDMDWLHAYDYGPVNPGPTKCPTTTYSFDYQNAHFVMLNVYCSAQGETATDGNIPPHLYDWLVNDLDNTDKPHVFVFGHEPAFPQPDIDNGRERHMTSSLNSNPANRDLLWALLKERNVRAYICGHTHNYSHIQIDDVWQLDVGHARGIGDPGARSTFVLVHVNGAAARFETYRDDTAGGPYTLMHSGMLTPFSIDKQASAAAPHYGEALTYTLTATGIGQEAYLWDPLPASLSYVSGSVTPPAAYSAAIRSILWEGTLTTDTAQVIQYQAVPAFTGTDLEMPVTNSAYLSDTANGVLLQATAVITPQAPHLSLEKTATPADDLHNDQVLTYTLTISGPGLDARVWDPLPASVHYVSGSVTAPATYSPAARAILWQGTLPTSSARLIRFAVTPTMTGTQLSDPIANSAWLSDTTYGRLVSSLIIVNARRLYLPLTTRSY